MCLVYGKIWRNESSFTCLCTVDIGRNLGLVNKVLDLFQLSRNRYSYYPPATSALLLREEVGLHVSPALVELFCL